MTTAKNEQLTEEKTADEAAQAAQEKKIKPHILSQLKWLQKSLDFAAQRVAR